MFTKLVCASLMIAASVPALAQPVDPNNRAIWPHMHQCTVTPGADWTGGGDSSNPIPSIGIVVKKNVANRMMNAPRGRIDLQLTLAPPATAGATPTVTAFAINTKGTGTSSGRIATVTGAPATVACIARFRSDPYAEDAARAASADMFLQMPRSRAAGWSCSVTGSENAPQFVITWQSPATQGQAERNPAPENSVGRSEWSWGVSNSGTRLMSIVPRGARLAGATHIACSSEVPGLQGKQELAVEKVERA